MLAGSGGFARCGHCQQVFDARSNLLDPHAGAHDTPRAPEPEHPAPDAGRDHPRDEYLAQVPPSENDLDAAPVAAQPEPGPEAAQPVIEPPFSPEPPISAEVPPLAAPVFAPESEHIRSDEVREFGAPPEHWPDAEERAPVPEYEPEPLPSEAEPLMPEAHIGHLAGGAEHEAEPEPQAPLESASQPVAEPDSARHDAHWHDDEPRFGGGVPSDDDAEPRFGSPPTAAAPQSESQAHAENVVAGEPHLEPHLRARLQAQAEGATQAEPHFGAATDEAQMRTAGAPPIFPEPSVSNEQDRHFAVTREARTRTRSRVFGYVIGSVIALALVVVLIAQLAWWRREAVMVYWPESQPLFARACVQLGCRLAPPRDIDGLQVEASDLRQVDGPHRLELRVPLRNRYGIALAYPAIELTLTDNKNDIAIRRVLWPQDYVAPGTPVAAGLPAHATQTMIVRLDSGNAIPTNFRVQIFYP